MTWVHPAEGETTHQPCVLIARERYPGPRRYTATICHIR